MKQKMPDKRYGSAKKLLLFFPVILLFIYASEARGDIKYPRSTDAGVVDKSLRQSAPPSPTPPDLKNTDSSENETFSPSQLSDTGEKIFVKRIVIEGNTIFDTKTLSQLVDVGKGKDLTFRQLNREANKITAFYAQRGYILCRAVIPEQVVKNSVVKLLVREGKIDRVIVVGNKNLSKDDFQRRFDPIKKEQAFNEESLDTVLRNLNNLMGVTVKSTLKPGELPGTSDLILNVKESNPYTFGLDGDNFGSRFTGRDRFGIYGSDSHLLKFGDQVSLRYMKSNQDQNYGQASYLVPINNLGTTVKNTVTYSQFNLGQNLSALNAGGNSFIYTPEISHPLYVSRNGRLAVSAGFDLKNFNNTQLNSTASNDRLRELFLSLGGNTSDQFKGQTYFDVRVQRGLSETDPNRPLLSRVGGRGDVTIGLLNITRYQNANLWNSYFILKGIGQLSSDRLLSPDLLSIGGMGTVRGYQLADRSGDQGYVGSVEYVLPFPWKTPSGFKHITLNDILSVTAFIDHGRIFVRNPQVSESDASLSGYGFSLRIIVPKPGEEKWKPTTSFTLGFAKPLGGPTPSDGSNNVWYLNGTMNF